MANDATDLTDFTEDYDRLRAQKARNVGSVELRILTNLAFASGEHWVGTQNRVLFTRKRDPNKLYLVFNIAAQMLYKMMGRLSSIAPVFKARADKQDPKSIAKAEVVNKLVRALDEKLDQHSRTWEILWWMAIGGVAFEYVPWVKDATMEPLPQFDPETNELLWTDVQSGEVIPESLRREAIGQGAPQERFTVVEDMVLAGVRYRSLSTPRCARLTISLPIRRFISPKSARWAGSRRITMSAPIPSKISKIPPKYGFSAPIFANSGTRLARFISKT